MQVAIVDGNPGNYGCHNIGMAQGKTFQSSHLEKVLDYNSDTGLLVIEFTNGSQYQYQGVPFSTYHRLRQSNTPGEFFHRNICGQYKYDKIQE